MEDTTEAVAAAVSAEAAGLEVLAAEAADPVALAAVQGAQAALDMVPEVSGMDQAPEVRGAAGVIITTMAAGVAGAGAAVPTMAAASDASFPFSVS